MRIALYGNSYSPAWQTFVQDVVDQLEHRNISPAIHHTYYDLICDTVNFKNTPEKFSSDDDLKAVADVLISIGGDGTLLSTIRYVKNSGVPVIGINTGRLGFLSSISKDEIAIAVDALLKNDYTIESRSLLKLENGYELFDGYNYGLNELVIQKRDSATMITIHAYLDGEFLNSYWADGLIISTPTGSTAYSLSCGGPIVTPDAQNFIITPIAAHNLNVRPLVIPDNKELRLKVEGRSNSFLISLDSRTASIDAGFELVIKKENFHFNLIKLNSQNFFNTIRNKMMWGLDKRN